MDVTPGSRRKKYVTRACDACKKRKSKCDGSEPCSRCINSNIACAYRTSYNRIQRRSQNQREPSTRQTKRMRQPAIDATAATLPQPGVDSEEAGTEEDATLLRLSEAEGDASVHTFLRRVSGHLASIGQGLPRYLFKREEEVFPCVDSLQTLILPPEEVAQSYLQCFFEHASVTYRYLHRGRTMDLLSRVYKGDETILRSNSKMARILLSMGVGCIWMASWRNEPLAEYKIKASKLLRVGHMRLDRGRFNFPPTLGILQAHVSKCQLELAFNRYNSAWMTLGIAVRLGQMIDIQKNQPLADPVDEFCRRGVCWALFMIDRYLSVSLGRPVAMRVDDIATPLPSVVVNSRIGAEEAKAAEGVKAHAQLTKIIGKAMSTLYPGVRTSAEARDHTVASLEVELQSWLQDTPSFFHPQNDEAGSGEDGFYNVKWIFRRQRRTIRAAYYFTNMLMYRGYLLEEFLHQEPSTPLAKPLSPQIRRCIDNAVAMCKMAGVVAEGCNYNAVYWTTSYFIFCAISILLVYLTLYRESEDRNLIESVVEQAMKDHGKVTHSANFAAQRLLEESRSRTQQVHSAAAHATDSAQDTLTPQNGEVDAHEEQPSQQSIDPNLSVRNGEQTMEPLTDPNLGDPSGLLNNVSLDMDPFGGFDDFGMIMDIGFDNNTMVTSMYPGADDTYPF